MSYTSPSEWQYTKLKGYYYSHTGNTFCMNCKSEILLYCCSNDQCYNFGQSAFCLYCQICEQDAEYLGEEWCNIHGGLNYIPPILNTV